MGAGRRGIIYALKVEVESGPQIDHDWVICA